MNFIAFKDIYCSSLINASHCSVTLILLSNNVNYEVHISIVFRDKVSADTHQSRLVILVYRKKLKH